MGRKDDRYEPELSIPDPYFYPLSSYPIPSPTPTPSITLSNPHDFTKAWEVLKDNSKHVDDTGNPVEAILKANGLSKASDLESLRDPDPDMSHLLNGSIALFTSPLTQRMFRTAMGLI